MEYDMTCTTFWKYVLAITAVWGMVISPQLVNACSCYVKETVAAQTADCGDCDGDGNCKSGTYQIPQYYKCASAGPGEPGKSVCKTSWSQIATFYPCEDEMNWTGFISCVLGCVGAIACCIPCFVEPTKLTCIPCALCVAVAGGNCGIQDYCECEKGDPQSCYRSVFTSFEGDACEG